MDKCPKCGYDELADENDPFSGASPTHLSDQGRVDFNNLTEVIKWGEAREGFSCDFFNSLKANLDKYPELTQKQRTALDNVIKKFRIK